MRLPLDIAPRVQEVLCRAGPVVALETTVVTHGLPPPEGIRTARDLEAIVRSEGAEPATIGVVDGRLVVGLDDETLVRLASAPDVRKLNPTNLAARLATRGMGSTTVAATMLVAHQAGIRVLATGGIGGVHRDAPETGDVSADLTALARVPMAVVCAGAKAILDLPRTVEALETLGVPIYGIATSSFPAFYRRNTPLPVDERFDDVGALAAAIAWHLALGAGTGIVVANPVPSEAEMPAEVYEPAMAQALAEARTAEIRGRSVTPFLLERLRQLTGDATVVTNRALLAHNARVGARLAVALAAAGP
jgi:pseudouridine-5'-phosphate glycosidase